jgi:hypothetical protein
MAYVVTGAYITAPVDDAVQGHVVLGFHRGALLPESVPEATIEHLLAVGLVAEGDDVADMFLQPSQTGPLGTGTSEPAAGAEADQSSAEAPPGNASKAAWVDYAVSQGADRDEAEGYTRDELVARYGE